MPIPGVEEPGVLSGLQQKTMNIPIKKRRFPMIRSESPPAQETPCSSEESEVKRRNQELGVLGEQLSATIAARNVVSSNSCDVSKISEIIVKREQELGVLVSTTGVLTSKSPLETKPCVGLGVIDDAKKKVDFLSKEKTVETEVPQSCPQEGRKMDVELSIGSKESLVSPMESQKDDDVVCKSSKSDPSLLILSSCKETHDTIDSSTDRVSSEVCSDRSNWDLNTTMDVWSGSADSDPFTNSFFGNTGFNKTDDCCDSKSSLLTGSAADLSLNKGKIVLDGYRSGTSSTPMPPYLQRKVDSFTGLRLDMRYSEMNSFREHSAASSRLLSTVGPNLSLQLAQQPVMNMNLVKSEPVDQNSKLESSIGSSCSSSNIGLSTTSSVKRELVENRNLDTAMPLFKRDLLQNQSVETVMPPSSVSPPGLVSHRSVKSELVQEANPKASMSKVAVSHTSVGRVMQHQESCASSSVLPLLLTRTDLCRPTPSTCSELTMDGDLLNHSILHGKESDSSTNALDRTVDAMISVYSSLNGPLLSQCMVEKSNFDVSEDSKVACDGHSLGFGKIANTAANYKEKTSILRETLQKAPSGSDHENHVDPSTNRGQRMFTKEDEYEDGEIREPLRNLAGEAPVVESKKIDQNNQCDIKNSQPSVPLLDRIVDDTDSDKAGALMEHHDENCDDPIEESLVTGRELNTANNALQKVSEEVSLEGVDEERSINTTAEKQLDMSVRKDIEERSGIDVSINRPSNANQGIVTELGNEGPDQLDKDISSRNKDSTLTMVEAPPKCNDSAKESINTGAAKESSNTGNKSRVINLPSSSAAKTFDKTKYISNRLVTSKSGKERDANFDGETVPRGRRNEMYTTNTKGFLNDKVHNQSFRSSRVNFRHEKGIISNRYGSAHNEWDPDHDFVSKAYNRPSYDRGVRHKYASSVSEFECEPYSYGIAHYDSSLSSNRQKTLNDNFPSFHRTSLRRLSPGDIDVSADRAIQKRRRVPRNISPGPGHCNEDDGSTFVGFRHADKFLRRLSSDNGYNRSQIIYDEHDDPISRGNRKYSPIQRKGFPRMRSKSPIQPRTRIPGPWSSPRRRSQDFNSELSQNRSPGLYRIGRMRSPDRIFRGEVVSRMRVTSPSFGARNRGEMGEIESVRESIRSRRSPPLRLFRRNVQRSDPSLDSREVGPGDEFIDGPLQHSKDKFHGDDCIDERRKFIEKRGPVCSVRPSFNDGDDENFQFPMNDGPRLYRFRPDTHQEQFVERSSNNVREIREFDEHMRHQISRRIRGIDEQLDGNYNPSGRVWRGDDFTEVSEVKRRRY